MQRRILGLVFGLAVAVLAAKDEERMGDGLGSGTVRDMRVQGVTGLPKLEQQPMMPTYVDTAIENQSKRFPTGQMDPSMYQDGQRPMRKAAGSPSPLQRICHGLGRDLPVYGMDFFDRPSSSFAPADQLAAPADYRISVGDALDVKVWGAVTMIQRVIVDLSGQVFLPQVGPISVAGKRYGDLDQIFRSAISRQFRNFDVQATLSHQKGLQVYVTGAARNPGAYSVSGFSSLINALLASGGPTGQGSLRRIELRRGGNLVGTFDLYGFLLQGDKSKDLSLQTGDVIHVPALESQVAITTGVLRPGVYELLPGETMQDLVRWAGGFALGSDLKDLRRERVGGDSGLQVEKILLQDSGRGVALRDGDILHVGSSTPRFANAVTLRGHVREGGRFPWKPGLKVSDLLPKITDLIPDAYWSQVNASVDDTNLVQIPQERRLDLNWEYAMIQRLSEDSLRMEVIPFHLGQALRDPQSPENRLLEPGDQVTIFGASDIAVPVRYRPVYVRLQGEVRRSGLYRVRFGEKMRDLVQRAGGLTPEAFVFGSKFTRRSTFYIQKENYRQVVDEMERQFEGNVTTVLASATTPEESKLLQNQVNAQRQWYRELKAYQPDGRLILELQPRSDLGVEDIPNIPLEDGDVLTIPSAPTTIGVFGEVSRQSAFLFKPGKSVGSYLSNAGGASGHAEESQAFVIRADGTLVSESDYGFLFWQLPSMEILPGDAIVMPRKMENTRWVNQVKDWSQILANFGITAAAITSLSRGF